MLIITILISFVGLDTNLNDARSLALTVTVRQDREVVTFNIARGNNFDALQSASREIEHLLNVIINTFDLQDKVKLQTGA